MLIEEVTWKAVFLEHSVVRGIRCHSDRVIAW